MSQSSTSPVSVPKDLVCKALDAEGRNFDLSLSDYKDQNVVVYFYPKDNTPGCTIEAQEFRLLYPKFQAAGCEIIGVSRDSLKSHDNFRCKQSLPFPLISDVEEALCTHFQVIKQKKMYGKDVRGIERSTFLIDRTGQIATEWRSIKAAGHAADVLTAVLSLK